MTDSEDACDRCGRSADDLEQTLAGKTICGRCRDQVRGRSTSRTADQRGLDEW
jgi:bacterioferritin-associated ferredoxin